MKVIILLIFAGCGQILLSNSNRFLPENMNPSSYLINGIYQGKIQTKRALLFGVSDYLHWNDISSSNDLEILKSSLQIHGFNQDNIQVVDNQKTTKGDFVRLFRKLIQECNNGDVLFIHLSCHGTLLEEDRRIVFYDTPEEARGKNRELVEKSTLGTNEFNLYVDTLRNRLGPNGQLVISFDYAHSGPNDEEYRNLSNGMQPSRGGFWYVSHDASMASYIMIASCKQNEVLYEITSNDKSFGVLSYAISAYLEKDHQKGQNYKSMLNSIQKTYIELGVKQNAIMAGSISEEVFEFKIGKNENQSKIINLKNKKTNVNGNVFVLSIGINNYSFKNATGFVFNNAVRDAKLFSELITKDFSAINSPKFKIKSTVLADADATKSKILKELNQIIKEAKPDDYFFFNFAGFSFQDSTLEEIYFVPYRKEEIITRFLPSGNVTVEKDDSLTPLDSSYISLSDLRDLMEFISAKNQFFLSEAGMTSDFRSILTSSMLKNSKKIASISTRNRVMLVPAKMGGDNCICKENVYQNGPFLTYMSLAIENNKVSLFDFFDNEKRSEIEYAIRKQEHLCESINPYSTFFYENDFIRDYNKITQEFKSGFRGKPLFFENDSKNQSSKLSDVKKYGLFIGINNYSKGAPEWENLNNPITDAQEMKAVFTKGYGYSCKFLKNATAEEFLENLSHYSDSLGENDQFVLYIAGHGLYDPEFFHDGFLVFSNSLPKSIDKIRRSYIPFSQVQNIIDNFKNNQILVLVDVCYGGQFVIQGARKRGDDIYSDVGDAEYISEKLKLKTRIVLTSGSLNVVPDGLEKNFSPFAKRLLQALYDGGGEQGYLTSMDLFRCIELLPSKPMKGELPSNHPGAEFILQKQR
jgi:hypothetical protein